MKRFLPKNLVGQLLLSVAFILLIAQAINGFLLYRGALNQNLIEASTAAVTRIAFGLERTDEARARHGLGPQRLRRAKLKFDNESAVSPSMTRLLDLEKRTGQAFTDLGLSFSKIEAASVRDLPNGMFEHAVGFNRGRDRSNSINRSLGGRRISPQTNGYVIISASQKNGQWV